MVVRVSKANGAGSIQTACSTSREGTFLPEADLGRLNWKVSSVN